MTVRADVPPRRAFRYKRLMASQRYVLAVDQGTTSTRATVLDARLKILGVGQRVLTQYFPRPALVEHDLTEVWASTEWCIARALRAAGVKGGAIAAVGITNQRETTGLWHRGTGRPLHRAIVWQDRRTADACAELKARGEEARVKAATGLVLDPYFSATKLRWLLDTVKGARALAEAGALCFGTIDTWLVYQMTGGAAHVTDVSNASRTLLMGLASLAWEPSLLELFGIPAQVLPRIAGSAELLGLTRGMRSLPDGVPVAGMAGDQQAALFGQACFLPGEAKCTYGTGAFLLMNVGEVPVVSSSGLLTTVAWRLGGVTTYALEGASFIAGAAVEWLRDGLGLIKRAGDVEALARTVPDTGDVVFVPALAGLGAPHWRPDARGLFAGLDRSTTKAHLARAVLEGVALQILDLADAMKLDSGRDIPAFKVDGGAATNDLLMQYQADFLGTTVVRPRNVETTSLGAAFLAGLGVGFWKSPEDIRRAWKAERLFKPRMAPAVRARLLEKWRDAVRRA
jgi:glycerol kinase